MSTSSISNHSSVENIYEGLLKTVSENEINFNAWKDSGSSGLQGVYNII